MPPVHTLHPDVLREIEEDREKRRKAAEQPIASVTHRINTLEAKINRLEAAPSPAILDADFWREVASAITSLIDVKFGRLKNENEAIMRRLKYLEEQPSLEYFGVYEPGQNYRKNALVTYEGCLWIAKSNTGSAPGNPGGSQWKMCVKRGRDGKDGKECPRLILPACRRPKPGRKLAKRSTWRRRT